MFAKKSLTTAVAVALGASVGSIQFAQAHSVFFPYVVGSDTVTSVVSIINTSDRVYDSAGNAIRSAQGYLQYTLYRKGASNAEVCDKVDVKLPTSQFDIQTIDIAGIFDAPGRLGVLFDDPSFNNDWLAPGRDFALGRGLTPFRGYLVVDNSDASTTGQFRTGEPTLTGEAFVFEYASGATWGYQAYHQLNEDPTGGGQAVRGAEFDYEFTASSSPSTAMIMPFDEFTTAFLVTPVNLIDFAEGAINETMRPLDVNRYEAEVTFRSLGGATGPFALYDRDENPVSGAQARRVTCVGRVEAQDLISVAAQPRLLNGGWGWIQNRRTNILGSTGSPLSSTAQPQYTSATARGTPGAVVIKLEYNLGGTFNDVPVPGVFNNAIVLRPDPFGTPPQPTPRPGQVD